MTEDLHLQAQCFENIKALCTNFKKDSATRKTTDYLNKRLTSLEQQWADFETRHMILVREIADKTVNYFSNDVYEKTKQLYQNTKQEIERLQRYQSLQVAEFDLTGMLDEGSDDKLLQYMSQQECNFKAIHRAMSKIDMDTITEKWEFEDHLTTLKHKWKAVDKLHWDLEALLKGSKLKDQYYKMFVDVEKQYDVLKKHLNSSIWSSVEYQRTAPRIEIPEFSGNYNQWISFKDLFRETIHNNPAVPKAQKMQHLKAKLRGEAERLVQHLTISADNYDSCWEILAQRYDNRRLQFTSYMNTMQQLPVIQQPNSYNLKKMHDVITECLNGLRNMSLEVETWDPMIVFYMSQKLDTITYNEYMKEIQEYREVPNLHEFLNFLEHKFMAYETMQSSPKEASNTQKINFSKNNSKTYSTKKPNYDFRKDYSKTYFTTYGKCPFCNGNHVLMQCPKFIEMDTSQRNNTVAKLHLCKNCLYSHGNGECTSAKTCLKCNSKHHTLLHNNKAASHQTGTPTKNQRPSTSSQPQSSNHLATNNLEVLLTTVQLKVKSLDGTYVTLRALLDQGSQVNLITENAAQLLRLPRRKLNATISGIGTVSGNCKGILELSCKSIHSEYTFETRTLILKKLSNSLPNSTFGKTNWSHLENLKLADPEFNISRSVDLLLGADVYSEILLEGVLRGDNNSPIAQQTHLGWILCGKLKTFNCHATFTNLNELTKFWESEDITQNDEDVSRADQCETDYQNTTKRDEEGKYIVKMPMFQNFEERLGKSKAIAVSQFLQLEKRLNKNKELSRMYSDFINEYKELKHMRPSSPVTTSTPACFLPHHGVLRENSTTTKLRVVFNASQKTTSGKSLNSLMEKGPNLQKDIQDLILKWRTYRYAFTADIEKMYRCIWISEDQQHLQKIIWRDSLTKHLQTYDLCTVTYGTKCAPWLAMRTLKQLALDDGHKYPDAAKTLLNQFYVDDLVSGHHDLENAKELQQSLIALLKGGGMNLHKWSSNDPSLLKNLSKNQIATGSFDFKREDSTKTLGLGWNPEKDTFTFNWNLEMKSAKRLTKRNLLSEISKLYDPLGWLSPVTITAKLLFQRVWTTNLGWDETLPENIQKDWLKLKVELPNAKNMRIDRWIGSKQKEIELLGFCDASEKAYSCVIYSRVTSCDNEAIPKLLIAKTRVAPLSQKLTLPRLELCGALLLSSLVKKTLNALSEHDIAVWTWCDSKVVLAWLQGEAGKREKYVENRVTKIKQIIPAKQWSYVKSEENPADCASRGLLPTKLQNFKLWWNGPEFLKTFKKEVHQANNTHCLFTTNIGNKDEILTTLAPNQSYNFIADLLIKYSTLTRVNRVTAWVLRFIANTRTKTKLDTAYLTANELITANEHVIKYVQCVEFTDEYKLLSKNLQLSNKSKIYKLSPYLDTKGIIRVGGRLKNSILPIAMKHPAILPRTGKLTQMVINHAHVEVLHGGARLTLANIRQRYWILGGSRAVKSQLSHCVLCHRYKILDNHQMMADLPQQRATPSRPFFHTGVDLTGYVEVKLNKGRGVKTSKGYIAIFVCMATKAVHIELVSDLSTETFIAAFQRMCARRGTPKHVYSDCGTNFVGASKVLRHEFEIFKQTLTPEFFDKISQMEVEWHLNVPAWPSAGGLWESAVRSMKYHLKRVLGDQKLTYEDFLTLLTKIEACMNSRPLCPLTEDPEEFFNYLTPGHFLTGSATMSLPLSDYEDVRNVDLRQRWQLTEHMLHKFWKTWSNEYLTQLQSRCKWQKPMKNLQEGDVVLVKDNNLPPGKWAMGRVTQLHPGSDGLVRVATIKTQTSTLKRPIVKLSPLPTE